MNEFSQPFAATAILSVFSTLTLITNNYIN